ncbi:EKA-like protein [Blumeria hordei DH14]|uniref:EKA-like protein n=1 Tax=Blumeria graminis f. sp. hordei (strain DH14) TaxID=546991 RepID=N1JN08_BLUG1|nr:EKA-like protein [Blumeria hordei DH14]
MGDAVIDSYIQKGLDSSRWYIAHQNDGPVSETTVKRMTKEIAVPAVKQTVISGLKKANQATTPQNANQPPSVATEDQLPSSSESRKEKINGFPPELQAMIEAEERRAAQAAKNITFCTAAINAVEIAVSLYSEESSDPFIDSMKIYLRAAIAQFMKSGPSAASPILPQRPSCQDDTTCPTDKRTTTKHQETQREMTQAKTTWATVARGTRPKSMAPMKNVKVIHKQAG